MPGFPAQFWDEIFEQRLQERLSLVMPWIEFIKTAEENSPLEATEPVVDCSPR